MKKFSVESAVRIIKKFLSATLGTDRFSFRITQIRKQKNLWHIYIRMISIFQEGESGLRISIDTRNGEIINVREVQTH